MTPEELDLILSSGGVVAADPAGFSESFYDTLFELEPATRSLFPSDMAEQRRKLVDEFQFMIRAATAWQQPDTLDAFVLRTRALGRRHVEYGVTVAMYEPVTDSLLATLQDAVDGFGADHRMAWSKLLRLVSETMLEGATPSDDGPS